MKKAIIQFMFLSLIAISCVSFVKAQSSEQYRANIPFKFSVGSKQYTAGTYSIEVRGDLQKFFVLRDTRGQNAYAAKTNVVDTKGSEASLDFVRLGDGYALIAIKAPGMVAELPKQKLDDKLAHNSAERRFLTVALSKGK